jgi:hypothetical protein
MHRWENNIKLDLKEAIYEDINWIQLADKMIPSGMWSKHSTP